MLGLKNINEHNIYYYNTESKTLMNDPNIAGEQIILTNTKLNSNEINAIVQLCGLKKDGILRYDALIDAGSLLKNYSVEMVVKQLYDIINNDIKKLDDKYHIVYVDGKQDIYEYYEPDNKPTNPIPFSYPNKDVKYFYYYDNQHIVGTDIKQPKKLYGLITMSYINTYTNISQAAFRLRQLGKTHYVDYVFETNIKSSNNVRKAYNEFIDKLKLINNKNNNQCIYNKYLFILYSLLKFNRDEQDDKLSYLFNQNVLYYYKLVNSKIFNVNGLNSLFIYID